MAGINKVIIVGNLGNDPEMRTMPNGEAVANISVATSETWTDKTTGERILIKSLILTKVQLVAPLAQIQRLIRGYLPQSESFLRGLKRLEREAIMSGVLVLT